LAADLPQFQVTRVKVPTSSSGYLYPFSAITPSRLQAVFFVQTTRTSSGATEFAGQENAGLENDGQTIKVSYVELHKLTLLSRKYWTLVVIKS